MNWTPYQVYLNFRTAPIGSLTVTGALYETGTIMATAVGVSYGVGYTAGTATAYLIQTYAPSLWDNIGGTVAVAIENICNAATLALKGSYEKASGTLFGLTYSATNAMKSYGGDYSNSVYWSDDERDSCKFAPEGQQEEQAQDDCNWGK